VFNLESKVNFVQCKIYFLDFNNILSEAYTENEKINDNSGDNNDFFARTFNKTYNFLKKNIYIAKNVKDCLVNYCKN